MFNWNQSNSRYGAHPPYAQPYPPQLQQPTRRKVWPWVLLAFVLVPVLGFVACTALVGAGINAVDQARKGGTVAIGETFTYASGLAITVSAPKPYEPTNEFTVSRGNEAYEVTITITNNTPNPVGAVLITKNATVNAAPAQEVFDDNFWPSQDIAVGQQLNAPFRFQVKKSTSGPLQIAVTDTFNEPVFFNGSL
jgi:hypothetical protein